MTTKVINQFQGNYRFLSNFAPLRTGGTTEHLYQAAKTLDPEQRSSVLLAETPGEAKKLGSKVTLRPDWEDIKIQVMTDLVTQKFYTHMEYMAHLEATSGALLIEGNDWGDKFWGVDLKTGKGENHLGVILMTVRSTLNYRAGK
jgi:ribA/ribD-fused uncharacterized protein